MVDMFDSFLLKLTYYNPFNYLQVYQVFAIESIYFLHFLQSYTIYNYNAHRLSTKIPSTSSYPHAIMRALLIIS